MTEKNCSTGWFVIVQFVDCPHFSSCNGRHFEPMSGLVMINIAGWHYNTFCEREQVCVSISSFQAAPNKLLRILFVLRQVWWTLLQFLPLLFEFFSSSCFFFCEQLSQITSAYSRIGRMKDMYMVSRDFRSRSNFNLRIIFSLVHAFCLI